MLKVNSRKTINHLAKKSFYANKTRNIFAIGAIILTTVLFTSLFTMGMGTVESLQRAMMRQAGGDGHAVLKYITDEQFDAIKNHRSIKKIAYDRMLCDGVENKELLKRHAEFWYDDKTGLKLGFIELKEGHIPQAENEVIVDLQTLQLLGLTPKVGSKISLKLKIRDEIVTRDFVLSGWWEGDPAFNTGQIFASRAYVEAHQDELRPTYYEDQSLTGTINAYIMFSNSMNLESKLNTLLEESGFSCVEGEPNYIASNVNWAYMSTNFGMDEGTLIGLGCGLLLIGFAGYLIIYNIFQIAVVNDIRFYGLLKTIGTTGKQLRRILRMQAIRLCAIGIPMGLFLGFFSGKALVPLLMGNSNYATSPICVSANPLIFLASVLVTLITVYMSVLKPSRMAGKVSPIEAVKYTESEKPKKKEKKSMLGSKMYRMALSNVGRNKKRTLIVVMSLSLSIILLNIVVMLSSSIDMNKFLAKFVDTDFLIAHADYFNGDFSGIENQVSEQMIATVKGLDGFEEGGRLYGGVENIFFAENPLGSEKDNKDDKGNYYSAVYGLEELPMERLELIDGELNKEKLLSGDYILEGIFLDDNEKPVMETAQYKVGDTVKLYNWRIKDPSKPDEREYVMHTFTVMGHVAIKHYTNTDRSYWGYLFYLPAKVYKTLVDEPAVMSYAFNVEDDKEAEVETFLKSYTKEVEPMMNYESKFTTVQSFSGMQKTVLLIGSSLAGIIGLIGILNFINAMLTSIMTRKKEFAMLQSIGMTRRQLRKMLCYEGLYYASLSGIFSVIVGMICSRMIVKVICEQMWFLSYHLITWPLFTGAFVLLILGVMISNVLFSVTDKHSIVERLREAE